MRELLAALPGNQPAARISGATRNELRETIAVLVGRLQEFSAGLDPVLLPANVLDPSDPQVMGTLIANTLLSQQRRPVNDLPRFYGSGVYALYYHGDFDAYAPISGTETPIYVGKADPAEHGADSVVEQGERLSSRLHDHQRSITAVQNLRIEDFECRYLVVKSAWQNTAETYLIEKFKPIWNNEVGICYGFGKHGDSSETRKNTRSPWDTLHPGRRWALTGSTIQNPLSVDEIKAKILQHFKKYPPVGASRLPKNPS